MKKSAVLLLATLNACVAEPSWTGIPVEKEDITFDIRVSGAVRSSVSPDESALEDLNLVIYDEGTLYASCFFDDLSDVSLSLDVGRIYDVYALANVGEVKPARNEEDFLTDFCLKINGVEELDGCLPMASSCVPVTVSVGMTPVRIELVRLVSKVNFAVENDALEGLRIESVRLCQSALKVFPFNNFGGEGSKATASAETADGDYASEGDLDVLNTGGAVCFYTLENCQGVLLPDNDDPWRKVPESLGEEAGLATYIEVGCRFDDAASCEGTVLYRFYLGKDDCRDFNVVRNSDVSVTLCLTEDGINRVSWKVEADVELPDVSLEYTCHLAEYVFQYSYLEFPSASPGHPVILEVCGNSVSVTGERQEELFNVKDSEDNSIGFFAIVPQAPGKVFFNSWNDDEPLEITLKCGSVSETITYAPEGIRLVLYEEGGEEESVVRVCESGLLPVDAYVYLADKEDGSILDLEGFLMPEEYAEYVGEDPDYQIREVSVCLDDMYEKQVGRSYVSSSLDVCGLDDGEDYIQGFRFWGLDAGGPVPMNIPLSLYDDNVFCLPESDEVDLIVLPAFRFQGYLGEYVNYQMAPGDMAAEELMVGLEGTVAYGSAVSAELRRVSLGDPDVMPDQTLWDSGEDCEASVSMAPASICISFSDPDPVDSKALACGAMMVKASVRNPISGRLIEGFYTFDLVLYLSIGLQVDVSGYELAYSFVPFSVWSLPEYSDFWNAAIGGMLYVKASDYYGGGSVERRVQVDVPKSEDEHPLVYTLPQHFSTIGQDSVFDEIVSCLLPLKNTVMDFSFYSSSDRTVDALEITRSNASAYPMYEDYADGAKGYYRVVRQCDAENLAEEYGLENHLVEVAYGSFEAY